MAAEILCAVRTWLPALRLGRVGECCLVHSFLSLHGYLGKKLAVCSSIKAAQAVGGWDCCSILSYDDLKVCWEEFFLIIKMLDYIERL